MLGCFDEMFSPPVHFLSLPRGHSTVKNAQTFIWNHKVRVNAQDLGIALAKWAGAIRIVEGKKIRNRFFKTYSIQFKKIGKAVGVLVIFFDVKGSFAFINFMRLS